MKISLFLVLLTVMVGNAFAQNSVASKKGWTAVYAHDENGKPTYGDISDLMEGLRKGYSLRAGWSWSRQLGDSTVSLEHFADPIFVTISQRKDVSMIINPHPLLRNYLDISKHEFDNPNHIWQCVLTTRGTFNAIVYNQTNGEIVKSWPQKHKMTWYLEYP